MQMTERQNWAAYCISVAPEKQRQDWAAAEAAQSDFKFRGELQPKNLGLEAEVFRAACRREQTTWKS